MDTGQRRKLVVMLGIPHLTDSLFAVDGAIVLFCEFLCLHFF